MHEELEATLRELEAKLPDLRHLIADSGVVLTTSTAALVLAARLLRAITAADEVASLLRLTLLNNGELVDSTAPPTQPVPPTPTPPAPSPPEPPVLNPAEITATGSGLTDSDYALQEALGLVPKTTTSFDQSIADRETTVDEVAQSVEAIPIATENAKADALLHRLRDLSNALRKLSSPSLETEEYLKTMDEAAVVEGEIATVLDNLREQIDAAFDRQDAEGARELAGKRRQIEQALARLTPAATGGRVYLSHLKPELGAKTKNEEALRTAFRLTGHPVLETFDEIRTEYNDPLEAAMLSYLRNESEAKAVTHGAMAHGERVWTVAEGEVSVLELLASLAVQQIERLIPRPQGEEERYIPTPKQVFRYLTRHRIERLIEDIEKRLDHLRLSVQESIREVPKSVHQEITTMERLRDEVMRQFYNGLLRMDDEDTGEGDARGARITPPPPMRGPGATRTFDEALALARNP